MEEVKAHIQTISFPATAERLRQIQSAQENDSECQSLIQYVENRWARYKKDVLDIVKQ